MGLCDEISSKKLEQIPSDVIEFMKTCEGVGLNFSDCNIELEEFDRTLDYNIIESRVNVLIQEKNELEGKSVQFSYIKDINYSYFLEILKELKETKSQDKEQYIKNFIENLMRMRSYGDDVYFEEIISDYIDKHKCNYSLEIAKEALREEAEFLYEEDIRQYEIMSKIYEERKDNELNIEAAVHTPQMDIVYFGNVLKAGIFTETGGMIFLDAVINENNTISVLNVYSYESVSDISFADDAYSINYLNMNVDYLSDKGIKPLNFQSFDFKLLLKEYNLEDLQNKPIVAVYKLREILLSKFLNFTETKNL